MRLKCAMLVPAVLINTLSFSAFTQPKLTNKPAWQWSSDERIAARLDPAGRAARLEAHRQELERRGGPGTPHPFSGCDDILDGNAQPQLFLVTELFPALVTSAFVSLPKVYPLVVRKGAHDVFRSDAEWQRFASITAPYAKLIARERELLAAQNHATPAELDQIRNELASVRAQKDPAMIRALDQSRAAFGKEAFDRMLYTVVAPGRSMCIVDSIRDGGRTDLRTLKSREDRVQFAKPKSTG
jgi:hypothetical protein